MKHPIKFIKLLPILFLLFACSKVKKDRIETFNVKSTNTGFDYTIWVSVPEDYSPTKKYETLYVLDANVVIFKIKRITKICDDLSKKHGKQNVIIVGISSENNRDVDFTPGEGVELYTSFLKDELIPKIEANYSVDSTYTTRTIMGHSYGGLYASYLFTQHPTIFKNYIALSPSLWFNNGVMFTYESSYRTYNWQNKSIFYVGAGGYNEDASITLRSREWQLILTNFYPNVISEFHVEKAKNHNTSAFENSKLGLDFYFKNK